MFQGAAAAAYYSTPVYGHSHYKKFWLKKMESEDDPAAAAPPEGGVLMRNKSAYAMNCSPLELRGSCSPPSSSSVRMTGVKSVTENNNIKKARCPPERNSQHKSELDYTLAIGVGVGVGMSDASSEENRDVVSDGFSEDKFHKFMAPGSNSMRQEDTQPFNTINSNSPRAVTRMCTDCKTVKTPLWRNGPQGPKSLCNACGIRYKKLGKRPTGSFERPSSPPTPPISPSAKQIIKIGKRKRESEAGKTKQQPRDAAAAVAAAVHHQPRKKIKTTSVMERLVVGRSDRAAMGPGSMSFSSPSRSQSDAPESPRLEQSEVGYYVEERNRNGAGRGEALRRWREVERIKRGLPRYGKIRSLAKDEEEGAVLLMALSCGVASC